MPFAPKYILVPTDFSEVSTAAVREAVVLAERFGADISTIYAERLASADDSSHVAMTRVIPLPTPCA